jgi:hypothetical protein
MSYKGKVDLDLLKQLAEDPAISAPAAATQLGVSISMIYHLCSDHGLRFCSTGVRRGRLAPQHDYVVKLAADATVSYRVAAARLGVHDCTLRNYLHRHNIPWVGPRSYSRKCSTGNSERDHLFLHLAGYHQLTNAQIGKAFDLSREYVRQILERMERAEDSNGEESTTPG